MIYLSDDYLTKYSDALSYCLSRSAYEGYSFDYVEHSIAYSRAIEEFERSNVTIIAFSSFEKLYQEIFPSSSNDFVFDEYGALSWCGYAYMRLFLTLQITFEALFFLIPIDTMLRLYPLYHEMSITQLEEYGKKILSHTILHIIMRKRGLSSKELANKTGLSPSTISALRYKKRDIAKLESSKLHRLSIALNVKMEALLPHLDLTLG